MTAQDRTLNALNFVTLVVSSVILHSAVTTTHVVFLAVDPGFSRFCVECFRLERVNEFTCTLKWGNKARGTSVIFIFSDIRLFPLLMVISGAGRSSRLGCDADNVFLDGLESETARLPLFCCWVP
jgi:hypothetical protein